MIYLTSLLRETLLTMGLSSLLNILYYIIAIQSFLHFACTDSLGLTLRLIPAFSPESPLYPGNLTIEEKINKAVEISLDRAHYLISESSPNYEPDTIRVPVDRYRAYYVVELSIGTPPKRQVLLMDTGSGITWTQCTPCTDCFKQTTPIFNPSHSQTYKKIPCSDPVCAYPFRCVNGECKYEVEYGGRAITTGLVSTETFTVENEHGAPSTIPGVIFGCGNDNKNFSFSGGKMTGILGLNNNKRSFVRQMFPLIQGRYSYCLAFGEGHMTTSLIKFGDDIKMPSKDVKTTYIVKQNIFTNNYLNLEDISVGDNRIRFAPGTFTLKPNGTGGCLMDTGTPTTFLEEGPYEAVMAYFDDHYKSHGVERVHDRSIKFEYCYRANPKFRAYIGMTYHFGQGAEFVVAPAYAYAQYRHNVFCVAINKIMGKTIIGAWHQQDMRILYDLNLGMVQFVTDNCARDRHLV